MKERIRKTRCAVYTRKSSEEGLEQEFNSLDAQRESCKAYITSQRSEGWVMVPDSYDDGGISGGTMERPALKRLFADIEAGLVNVVVVYKIDRLSRSLADFARMVELFDTHEVTFVSVTQQFNTTTSMGRLTLNILLSFAQFEREVTAERIRDKFAASRKKGMWMGGRPPLGYDIKNRKLVVNKSEAKLVRHIFERFLQIGSATLLVRELAEQGYRTKSWITLKGHVRKGRMIDKGFLYKMLSNRVYLGLAVHKGTCYPGEHDAIIDQVLWDRVHSILSQNAHTRANITRASTPALLKGLIRCKSCGCAMTPSHTRRRGRLYRYYVCQSAIKKGHDACPVRSVPAADVEGAVIDQIRALIRSPEVIAGTLGVINKQNPDGREQDIVAALHDLDPLWDELFPLEQARIISLLVETVDINPTGLDIHLRIEGLNSLINELQSTDREAA
jgi:DNA invertase Pin-like site-specific DNA recombinase